MLVTMATPISSHVKDKNSIFTVGDEGWMLRGHLGIQILSLSAESISHE